MRCNEWYRISDETASILNETKHITAVGTTSIQIGVRINDDGYLSSGIGETNIFITQDIVIKVNSSLQTPSSKKYLAHVSLCFHGI